MKEQEHPKVMAKKENDQAVIECPYCGDTHYHSWYTGYRVPHCKFHSEPNYYIICKD
jgi:C4-type Zn-finger protein